jgi:hypothetical protein
VKRALKVHAAYFEGSGARVELPEPTEGDLALGDTLLARDRRLFG